MTMPNKERARRSPEDRKRERAERQEASDKRKAKRDKARKEDDARRLVAVEEANEAIKKGRVKMPRFVCDKCGKEAASVVPCLHSARLLCPSCEAADVAEAKAKADEEAEARAKAEDAPTPLPGLPPLRAEDAEDLLD
jgi:formylmethanofuran dehydrogenase subunit E